jgi:hypothetical protein
MSTAFDFPSHYQHPSLKLPSVRIVLSAAVVPTAILLAFLATQMLRASLVEAPVVKISVVPNAAIIKLTAAPVVSNAEAHRLPAEWQWQPSTVKYEHMFGSNQATRTNQPTRSVDWIRTRGALPTQQVRTSRRHARGGGQR